MTLTTLPLSRTGGTVALREAGVGEPLILVHGVGMQSAAWAPQIEALSRTHRVIAVDLPGHGCSSPLPANSGLPAFVAWLNDVTTTLALKPVNLAGHSMGALIAGGFASTYPDATKRVALLNGVFRRDASARAAVEARAAEIQAGAMDLKTPLDRWFGDTATDRAARTKVAGWLSGVERSGYGTAYAAFAAGDRTYADQMGDIRCPFLAITGEDDPNSTPAMSRAMAQAACQGEAVVVSGHRHMVNLTAPDVVTEHLKAWLARPADQKVTS